MDRKTAGNMIRDYLGPRLIRHDEWGSLFDYSAHFDSSDFAPRRYLVAHYEGGGSPLATMLGNINSGMTPREALARKMRQVDDWHKNGNGWARGFAYCLALSPYDNSIGEARSAWVTHGAHFDDPYPKLDFPVFWPVGGADGALTPHLQSNWQTIKTMLHELFGFVPSESSIKVHGEVQTSSWTNCAGTLVNGYVKADRVNAAPPPADGQIVWPRLLQYGMWHPATRIVRQRLGQLGYHIWDTAGTSNLAGLADQAARFTWAVRYAVKKFQETHKDQNGVALVVDGIVGPKTRGALGV